MKKLFTLLAVMTLVMAQTAISQDINLKFTGVSTSGTYVRLDSVLVQSVNRSWSETVIYPDTVLTFQQTGIAEAQGTPANLVAYPNPANGVTNVAIAMPQSGEATLQLYTLAGQRVAERTIALQTGENHFEVRLQKAQVYLLAVTTAQGRNTVKLLNRGAGAENSISYLCNSNVMEKRQSANPFQSGDVLKITGFATHNGAAISSREVQQQQTTSETFMLFFTLPVAPVVAPTVTTTAASSITSTSATTGGNVTSDGGAAVTARGVCWSTSQNPTISGSHTTDGTGAGSFTSNLTGLTPGTTYYVRAYATNAAGTAYGSQITFTTAANAPTVVTTAASSITSTTATTGGNVTADGGSAVTARGVCWSTSQNPTISGSHTTDGTGAGSFTSNLTGLTAGTTYYVRAYATNAAGTAYGNQITFTTLAVAPTVTTTAASSITSTTATIGGNVTSDGGSAVTARGVCWSTSQNPTISGSHTTDGTGTGSFTSSLTGLTAGTTYYVRAYATNAAGTAYGSQITFTTTALPPTVTTTAASNITSTTATSGGNVTSAGSSAVTARGVCWSTSQNPTVRGNHTTSGSGTGSFTSSITGLTPATTYYVRAYAISSVDTAYGSQITFTTSAVAPTVTTTAASNITSTTATSGGNVTSAGSSAVTARGVCWSTSQNPTISGSHTTDGTGTGSFTSSLTGLTAGTTYYVRAYATNAAGTAYGSQITFTTALPNNVFSTAAGTYVYFSPGNLQWSAKNGGSTATTHTVAGGGTAAGTWRFAPNQWDTIGRANSNVSSSYSGWIDMFGWGTSGYNNKYPYMTSTTTTDYGNGAANISGTNYDWGVYNAIYNPKTSTTDAPGTWRTLTDAEWRYLIRTRSTTSGIRYAKAQVNGINGLILVPDNWSTSTYAFTSTNTSSAAFTTNVINAATWTTLENAGCVFLPAAGYRSGTTVYSVGTNDGYWSSTYYDNAQAYYMYFYSSVLSQDYVGRNYGYSVRLVRAVPEVNTSPASNITDTSATFNGIVLMDAGTAVTVRGFCWSTSQNPTVSGSHTSSGSGIGGFTSNVTGLSPATTYYVRAYATNANGTAYGNQISFTTQGPYKAFSVSGSVYAFISPGNLQWSAKNGGSTATTHTVAGGGTAAGTWRFAPNQWDTIGAGNGNISSSYSGWIDLFGWGTSGYNSKYPYMTSLRGTDYGNGAVDISGTNYDWGVYNAIYNPKTSTTDAPGTWRTPTESEWWFILNIRSTPSGIRFAKATVNGVPGVILVPDSWNASIYVLNNTNTSTAAFTSNVISAAAWATLENAGCAFIPIAGERLWGNDVRYVGTQGYYWTATEASSDSLAYYMYYGSGGFNVIGGIRRNGYSVRLLKTVLTGQVAQLPTVSTTSTVSNITQTSATSGGLVINSGSTSVTARGVCWSTSPNPTISGSHTTNGTGTGSFTSSLTGLTAGTTYYVRAYATNAAGTAYGNQITFTTTAGSASPTFSVSSSTRVVFSPGNLQWSAKNGGSTATTHAVAGGGTAAGTWRFAPHQWDTIGANNRNISSSYSGWIDLFGWGTSGYHDPGDQYNTNYQPYSISTSTVDPNNNYYGYGPSASMTNIDLSGSNYDWGVYNAIYNPKTTTTDAPGTWRTLTDAEWRYLIRTRSTTSGIRYAKAQVNGINGLILVPDNWSTSTYVLNSTNTTGSAYTSNVISAAQWTTLENAGAIFLPAAGSRAYVSVGDVGSEGYYWSASNCGFAAAWQIGFYSGNVINAGPFRYGGTSVRLVKNAN